MKNLTMKELKTFDEFEECLALQDKIWNLGEDKISRITMKALSMEYPEMGLLLGTYMESEMVGFGICLATRDPQTIYGHIFGVLSEYRNSNIGFQIHLKLREICLKKGITKFCWTYEPLEGKNTNLYMNKVGAIAVKYQKDYYNVVDDLNKQLPFDRFVAEWHMESERVIDKINGRWERIPLTEALEQYPVATAESFPEADAVLAQIPSDLQKLKKTNLDKALEFRLNTRKIFDEYINNRGFAATELFSERIEGERKNYYLLEKMK